MSTLSACSGTGLSSRSSRYRPAITLSSIAVEAESVVVVESRSRTLSARLTAMELPPPSPPPPPCSKTPHPAVPSRAAPARPAPPILRKSRRVTRIAPGVSPVPNLTSLVFIDPPFSCHNPVRVAFPATDYKIGIRLCAGPGCHRRRLTDGSLSEEAHFKPEAFREAYRPCTDVFHAF